MENPSEEEVFTYFVDHSLEIQTSAGKALVFADPHIGFELSRGLRIRTHFEERLAAFILYKDPDILIILGDVKEPIGLSPRLKDVLLRFLSAIRDTPVIITKGNHDGRIEEATKPFSNVRIEPYYIIDGMLFLHGHTVLPDVEFREAYLGHIHPAYQIKYRGISRLTKVFVRARKFLILPTINPYLLGTDVREGIRMIPFHKLLTSEPLEIFLPSGLHLGKVEL